MSKISVDIISSGIISQNSVVVENAVGADAGAFSPTHSVQIAGAPLSASNPLPILDQNIGLVTDTTAAADNSNTSVIALFKRLLTRISTLLSVLPSALTASGGLKVDGSSVTQPVSLVSGINSIGSISNTSFAVNNFPSTQPVSLVAGTNAIGSITNTTFGITSLPSLSTGSNAIGSITNTTFASTQSGTWNLANITGTISLPTGASTESTLAALSAKIPALGSALTAASVPVTLATDGLFLQAFGLKGDTSATGDSDNTGFVSLFKRLLGRLTTLFQGVAGTPNTNVISVQGITAGTALNVNQQSNVTTATTTFTTSTTSTPFTLANTLAIIVVPAVTGAPTLTLQVTLDGGTTWVATSITKATSATLPTVFESDSFVKVTGAVGLTNAFRFFSSATVSASTINIRSVIK